MSGGVTCVHGGVRCVHGGIRGVSGGKKSNSTIQRRHVRFSMAFFFLLVVLVGHVISSMANIVYFRYPFDDFGYPFNFSYPLNETFRHSINVTTNLTINNATTMYADNARSLLCTLIESEAAIVAIVVSLTLIAIQFTASAYSPRVIDISLKNPDMWILLSIYGMSIFYGLVLIKQVPHDSWMLFEDVSLAFWLGVFSYVALVPYIRNISNLLKPKNIVKRLGIEITIGKILNQREDEDPVQPVVDIIIKSIENHDFETVRIGLKDLTNRMIEIIDPNSEIDISKSFCKHLEWINKFATSRADEESSKRVIINLEDFGKKCGEQRGEKRLEQALKQAVLSIMDIGKNTVGEKRFKDTTQQAASSLAELTTSNEEIVKNTILNYKSNLDDLGSTSFQKFERLYEQELKKKHSGPMRGHP